MEKKIINMKVVQIKVDEEVILSLSCKIKSSRPHETHSGHVRNILQAALSALVAGAANPGQTSGLASARSIRYP